MEDWNKRWLMRRCLLFLRCFFFPSFAQNRSFSRDICEMKQAIISAVVLVLVSQWSSHAENVGTISRCSVSADIHGKAMFRPPSTTQTTLVETNQPNAGRNITSDYDEAYNNLEMGAESDGDTVTNNGITASALIDLPFSADVAFDAFQDPTRQPSWSSWLRSVEYIDKFNTPEVTKWTMGMAGIKFSFIARHTNRDRANGIIEWRSESGLRNNGRVEIVRLSDTTSRMRIFMSLKLPSIVNRLLGGNRLLLKRLVEDKMLSQTLENFRDVVLENDCP